VSTIWQDNRPHYISMPNIDKRTIYQVYLICFDKLQGWFPPHQNKEKSLYQCMSTGSFRRTAQHPVERSPLIFYLWRHVGTLKNHDAFKSSWKWRHSSPMHFIPSITFAAALERMRWSIVKYVHPLIDSGGEHFEHLLWIVFIYSKNTTIIKLGNYNVNVLRQL
jgi:hypothetical protein